MAIRMLDGRDAQIIIPVHPRNRRLRVRWWDGPSKLMRKSTAPTMPVIPSPNTRYRLQTGL